MPVTLIILLATIENMLPLLIGFWKTPPGYVFLGTVHHPADYFYYLSQFAQGSYRWITTVNLYTAESISPTFVGWSNVLTGRLFHIIGLSPFVAYHASVAFLTVILLFAAYKLAELILSSRYSATLALYLFALFHAFPILRDGQPSYGDYWNNFAVPRVRFGGAPHQLLLSVASLLVVYFALRWKPRRLVYLLGLGISSLILASLQPVLWVLITGMLLLIHGVPFAVSGISGFIPVLYLAGLFRTLPFSQLKSWEATQQTLLTPENFLTATGPIFLIAVFGLPAFFKKRTASHRFSIAFTAVSLTLFLSPIPRLVALSHVRFMSALLILLISVIASHSISAMKYKLLFVALLTLILIPNHVKTIELISSFNSNNAYHYLTQSDYDRLIQAGKQGSPSDTFLFPYPYNEIFPSLTGKRSFYGHPLLTIDPTQKIQQADAYFRGVSRTIPQGVSRVMK